MLTAPFSLLVLLALSLLSNASQSETVLKGRSYQPGDAILRCGKLIDGLSESPLLDQTVTIKAGRITSVQPTAEFTLNDNEGETTDLSDFTCLPGLINTHVHFDGNPEDSVDYSIYARRTREETLQLVLDNAKTTLLTGFTTVRHVGAWFPDTVYLAKSLIERGAALGPRIQTAGPYLTIPGGGGDLRFPEILPEEIPPESQQGIAQTPDEFRVKAEEAILGGADFLKVIASGAVFSVGALPGAPEMTRADIEAVVAVATAYDKKVTAHVHSDQSGLDAILAGVDSLEHASLLTKSTVELALERGVALSMDVYNGTYTDVVGREQGYPEVFLQRNTETTEAQRSVFQYAHKIGVTLLYGTDAAVLPHNMGGWQFSIMEHLGMTPMETIRSATSVPAEHMEIAADVGAIEPGRLGDLIAVRGDPLRDLTLLRQVHFVMKGGKILKTHALLSTVNKPSPVRKQEALR